jgi:hypothetical protein
MTQVLIHNGVYRNIPVRNIAFKLVKDYTLGTRGGYVTVDSAGHFGPEYSNVRIRVESINDIEIIGGSMEMLPLANGPVETPITVGPKSDILVANPVSDETDEQIMERIETRFGILDEMTRAAINGDIRAMIVVGPPGVGKSYGVEYQLEKAGLFDTIGQRKVKYEVIKGAMTPIGLYCTLYKHSDPKNVLVFDDCDTILLDDLSLNILKAALDSGKRRRIHWNADSSMLRREGVPDMFDFKGSVIFITNLKFENLRSKKLQDHLEALQSRCHFLDLTLDTMRDRFLRIQQIFRKGDLFVDYDITPEQGNDILDFMKTNENRLREMSLRMALKIADLVRVSTNWRAMAESTCMKNK